VPSQFRVGGIGFEDGQIMLERLAQLSRRFKLKRGAVVSQDIGVDLSAG
jgi:hypothetical protein